VNTSNVVLKTRVMLEWPKIFEAEELARIIDPGCQADHTLLLEGPQGNRKSTALRILAGDEYLTDHISDLGSKDSRIELHGKWILELAELDNVRRGQMEKVKAFLTARVDNFRLPYGRITEAVPRSCVFAATVNDKTPLTDETGARRFWPVRCGTVDVEAVERDRDQLWAKAFQQYYEGAIWWLDSAELNTLAAEEPGRPRSLVISTEVRRADEISAEDYLDSGLAAH
jgi:putative DNA primase/helicase